MRKCKFKGLKTIICNMYMCLIFGYPHPTRTRSSCHKCQHKFRKLVIFVESFQVILLDIHTSIRFFRVFSIPNSNSKVVYLFTHYTVVSLCLLLGVDLTFPFQRIHHNI